MKCCDPPVTPEEDSHREESEAHDLFDEILTKTEALHLKFSSNYFVGFNKYVARPLSLPPYQTH